jgi:sugar-specific transcriptional regulator TrmB
MHQHLISALKLLECSPKEIKFYLAGYEMGPAAIGDIARKAKIQRSTSYLIAEQLLNKRLLIMDSAAYNKKVIAVPPDTLIRLLDTRKRRIGRSSISLTEHIEELRDSYSSSSVIPRISTYHGSNGLRTGLNYILNSKTDLRLWTNQESEQRIFASTEHSSFIKSRISNNKHIKVLAVTNLAGQKLVDTDTQNLRETRLLPTQITFSAETYLFDSKVVILDFTADIVTIIIDNSSVYDAQSAQFELAWSAAKP